MTNQVQWNITRRERAARQAPLWSTWNLSFWDFVGHGAGHLSSIHQGSSQVQQARNHSPGGVDPQPIEDSSVPNTPPEQGGSTSKVFNIITDIFSHEEHHHDIGDSNQE